MIRVAINGFGTIGKRVADAVDAQDDMIVAGVTKTGPSFGCDLAVRKGFPLYCTNDDPNRIAAFEEGGYECKGGLSDLLSTADVVVDCAPGKRGAENLSKYKAAGIKHIYELVSKEESEMLKYKNFGRKSLTELVEKLDDMGISFGMDVDKYLKLEV